MANTKQPTLKHFLFDSIDPVNQVISAKLTLSTLESLVIPYHWATKILNRLNTTHLLYVGLSNGGTPDPEEDNYWQERDRALQWIIHDCGPSSTLAFIQFTDVNVSIRQRFIWFPRGGQTYRFRKRREVIHMNKWIEECAAASICFQGANGSDFVAMPIPKH